MTSRQKRAAAAHPVGPGQSASTPMGPGVAEALQEVRSRSFSGRRRELGKMIKCRVCGRRHRKNERVCIEKVLTPTKPGKKQAPLLLRGVTHSGSPLVYSQPAGEANPLKHILGAAHFAKKRLNKHPSKRQFALIRLVRKLVSAIPDATPEDIEDAKELAKEILGWNKKKLYGKWVPRK